MDSTPAPDWDKPDTTLALTLEAWSQGVVIGALVIMACITAANMRKKVLLHKLILIELFIAMPDCFFIFPNSPVFGWYLSTTSTLMIVSWYLHNFIARMKSLPFLSPLAGRIYFWTLILVLPYWVLEIYANYAYFNHVNHNLFPKTRPFEALCRDPWWLFTTVNLFWNIKYRYTFGYVGLIRASPRFGIMLLSMCASIVFIILDVLAVTSAIDMGGLNPFWKLAFVFKCFTDTIILDDFKTALDRLFEVQQREIYMDALSDNSKGQWAHGNGGMDAAVLAPATAPALAKQDTIVMERAFCVPDAEAHSITHSADSMSGIFRAIRRPNSGDTV